MVMDSGEHEPPTSAFVRCPFCDAILPPGSVIGDGLPGVEQDNDRLREALRVVASNMRALEDGGCDFPRVVDTYSVAVAALSGRSAD